MNGLCMMEIDRDKNRVSVNKRDVIIDLEYTYKEDEELRGLSCG